MSRRLLLAMCRKPPTPRYPFALVPRRYYSSAMPSPCFSPDTDAAAVLPAVESLVTAKWTLSPDGTALERSFKFKTFEKTWDFMTAVSLQCKIKSHHPEWSNVFNTTFIRWTTHHPPSLSQKDVAMAAICDALAKDFGELEAEPTARPIRELADKAKIPAGDCCTPKT